MNYVKQYAKDTTVKGIPSGKSYRKILAHIDEIKVIIELGTLFIYLFLREISILFII